MRVNFSSNNISNLNLENSLLAVDKKGQLYKVSSLEYLGRVIISLFIGREVAFSNCKSTKVAQAISDLIKNGHLTSEEADKLKKQLINLQNKVSKESNKDTIQEIIKDLNLFQSPHLEPSPAPHPDSNQLNETPFIHTDSFQTKEKHNPSLKDATDSDQEDLTASDDDELSEEAYDNQSFMDEQNSTKTNIFNQNSSAEHKTGKNSEVHGIHLPSKWIQASREEKRHFINEDKFHWLADEDRKELAAKSLSVEEWESFFLSYFQDPDFTIDGYENDLHLIERTVKYPETREAISRCASKVDPQRVNAIVTKLGKYSNSGRGGIWGDKRNNYDEELKLLEIFVPFADLKQRDMAKILLRKNVLLDKVDEIKEILKLYPGLVEEMNVEEQKKHSHDSQEVNLFLQYPHSIRSLSYLLEMGLEPDYTIVTSSVFGSKKESPINKFISELTDSQTDKEIPLNDQKLIAQYFALLISKIKDIDQNINRTTTGGEACSALEKLYLTQGPNQPFYRELAVLCLQKGATISSRLAYDMKMEMRAKKDLTFAPFLKAQNLLTDEELRIYLSPPPAKGSTQELLQKVVDANFFFDNMLSLYNLNPSMVSLERMSEIRMLRREVKNHLAQASEKTPEVVQLESLYQTFSSKYDSVVNKHLLLRELREISREIRQLSKTAVEKQTPSERLIKFYSLWGKDDSYTREESIGRIGKLFGESRKLYWDDMHTRITTAATQTQKSELLKNRSITWVHGTKSSSLPSIAKVKALIPTGQLIPKGVVPFSGEICGSDVNINSDSLSGEMLTSSWEEELNNQYYGSATRFLVSFLYAKKLQGYKKNEMKFDPQKAWERMTPQYLEKLLDGQAGEAVTVSCVDILRLRLTDPQADKKLAPYKQTIEEKLKTSNSNTLKRLHEALTLHLSYQLSEEEVRMTQDPNPYPVVFASMNTASREYLKSGEILEFLAKGEQPLGAAGKIQVAFTSKDKVEELQKMMTPLGVEVFDFDTAFYLETINMVKGSEDQKLNRLPQQAKISSILQRDILPHYATPFPEKPVYKEAGETKKVPHPLFNMKRSAYEDYKKSVEKGEATPRSIHDPMHATRAAIWSQMLANLYERLGKSQPIDRFKLALSTAIHDIARQDEGKDYWDEESGEFLDSYLKQRQLFLADAQVQGNDVHVHALKEKDPAGHQFTTPIQQIIHDADTLEILRVLRNPADFRKEELCFNAFPGLEESYKQKLIAEVQQFIALTEKPDLKLKLHQTSQSYYLDVLKMVNNEQFPTLFDLLQKEIKENMPIS